MAEHFLDRYVEIFPEFLEEDIYLAGESFGGQYIPYIAKAILEKRSLLKLRGLLIGDGWIEPISLYNSYLPYAIANNLVKNDSELYTNIIRLIALCQDILSKQVHIFVNPCFPIFDEIIYNGISRENNGECINAYDIRLNAQKPMCGSNEPSELEYVSAYLNRSDVMSTFNYKPSIDLLPDLLGKMPILIYNGEYDLVCNHWATENMFDNMTWSGESEFDLGNGRMVPIYAWIADGESAVFIGAIWLFILKEQQCVRITSVHCPNLFRSRQQPATYSPFKIMNDEFVTFEDDVLA
ncbi:unnamed protein product [Adineta steineri]|uniref:Pheromone-processing carboxypeptidase KEX1 n=1 Tax=Adineta steineri TaxID=433720 RepID=A0A815HK00_9BILA|nr:unnamed protein product [Adineta steineri]CAF1597083.1 unnamed protein product [Adineta steineri]